MSRKRNAADRTKIAQRVTTYMMLMGYIGDYQNSAAKELNRRIWKRNARLGKKPIRRLQCLLCAADSATLLTFTVSLAKLIWSDSLRVKRMIFQKKLSEKIRQRSTKKKARRGRPGRVRVRRECCVVKKQKGRKRNVVVTKFVMGFHIRPVWGSNFRILMRRKVTRKHVTPPFGSLMYRLAMAMNVLCYRNVRITSEWEFWMICFVQRICGFWRSVTISDSLSGSFASVAKNFGLCVVSSELLERMDSCFACSASPHCHVGN
ncbi:hypothetical protein RND81_05G038300 [Saponaria officinalis]|uniref:Uncharacterized protein n=1 Tax=Saponaria officinalis TaxID=3572 RepID=A0AAW1KX75_SAPOF